MHTFFIGGRRRERTVLQSSSSCRVPACVRLWKSLLLCWLRFVNPTKKKFSRGCGNIFSPPPPPLRFTVAVFFFFSEVEVLLIQEEEEDKAKKIYREMKAEEKRKRKKLSTTTVCFP